MKLICANSNFSAHSKFTYLCPTIAVVEFGFPALEPPAPLAETCAGLLGVHDGRKADATSFWQIVSHNSLLRTVTTLH